MSLGTRPPTEISGHWTVDVERHYLLEPFGSICYKDPANLAGSLFRINIESSDYFARDVRSLLPTGESLIECDREYSMFTLESVDRYVYDLNTMTDTRIDMKMVKKFLRYRIKYPNLSFRDIAAILEKDVNQVYRYAKYARKLVDSYPHDIKKSVDTSPIGV